jgi:uncharacterized protein (UPF0212 family)
MPSGNPHTCEECDRTSYSEVPLELDDRECPYCAVDSMTIKCPACGNAFGSDILGAHRANIESLEADLTRANKENTRLKTHIRELVGSDEFDRLFAEVYGRALINEANSPKEA